MTTKMIRGTSATVLAGTLGLVGLSSAMAVTYNPNPPQKGQELTITSTASGLKSDDIRISICTTEGFGLFKIPACAPSTNAGLNEKGQAVAKMNVPADGVFKNAHHIWMLPAQPASFSCNEPGQCKVLVVDHSPFFGLGKKTIERAPIVVK